MIKEWWERGVLRGSEGIRKLGRVARAGGWGRCYQNMPGPSFLPRSVTVTSPEQGSVPLFAPHLSSPPLERQ